MVIPTNNATCVGLCSAQHATLLAHVRAVGYASLVLLISNLVLVLWVLALRGGRLWGWRPVDEEVEAKILVERFRSERLPLELESVFDARFLRQLSQREAAKAVSRPTGPVRR